MDILVERLCNFNPVAVCIVFLHKVPTHPDSQLAVALLTDGVVFGYVVMRLHILQPLGQQHRKLCGRGGGRWGWGINRIL